MSGMRVNVGCAERDRRSAWSRSCERFAEDRGERVVLIGQSRGGALARALAVRHPELVCGLVMLGSPVCDGAGRLAAGAAHGATGGAARATSGCRGCSRRSCTRRRVLRRLPRGSGCAARGRHRGGRGVLAQRRHRRLARVPRSARRAGRGRLEPLRHVGSPARSTACSSRCSTAPRRLHGVDESDRLVLPARRERHHADAHRRRQHLRGAAAAV